MSCDCCMCVEESGSASGGSASGGSGSGGSASGGSASGGSAAEGPITSQSASGAPVTGPSATGVTPAGSSDGELVDPFCDPNNPRKVPFERVALAHVLIRGNVVATKCVKSHLSLISGMNVYVKNEFSQFTGSFKERGARFTLMQLDDETKKNGAVSASAGNHALAMCYHGLKMGIPITVVMPTIAPLMKIQKCKDLKGNVIVQGKDMTEARAIAMKLAKDKGAIYINGYDHPDIISGQGTIGIEILEQVPDVDAVIVPVGGGGLIAGISLAVKSLKPSVQVIGVESEACTGFDAALKAGHPVATESKPTIADGLAVPVVGVNAAFTAKDYIDRMIAVKEEDIAVSVLRLIELEKYVLEGAGATGVAAILAGKVDEFTGKNVVVILSGGNIDTTVLNRALERGLAADGRLVKAHVKVRDRPGGLAELCGLVASIGVVIKNINQERAWVKMDVFTVEVKLTCETRDYEHVKELEKLLAQNYEGSNVEHIEFPASSSIRQRFKTSYT